MVFRQNVVHLSLFSAKFVILLQSFAHFGRNFGEICLKFKSEGLFSQNLKSESAHVCFLSLTGTIRSSFRGAALIEHSALVFTNLKMFVGSVPGLLLILTSGRGCTTRPSRSFRPSRRRPRPPSPSFGSTKALPKR